MRRREFLKAVAVGVPVIKELVDAKQVHASRPGRVRKFVEDGRGGDWVYLEWDERGRVVEFNPIARPDLMNYEDFRRIRILAGDDPAEFDWDDRGAVYESGSDTSGDSVIDCVTTNDPV